MPPISAHMRYLREWIRERILPDMRYLQEACGFDGETEPFWVITRDVALREWRSPYGWCVQQPSVFSEVVEGAGPDQSKRSEISFIDLAVVTHLTDDLCKRVAL